MNCPTKVILGIALGAQLASMLNLGDIARVYLPEVRIAIPGRAWNAGSSGEDRGSAWLEVVTLTPRQPLAVATTSTG